MWQHEAKKTTRLGKYSLEKAVKESLQVTEHCAPVHTAMQCVQSRAEATLEMTLGSAFLL